MPVFALLLSIVLAAGVQSSIATGEVRGTVRDPSGAVVPNSQVAVVNMETDLARRVVTDEFGSYRVLVLPPGSYQIRVDREGFRPQIREEVRVTIGELAVIDFDLQLSSVSEGTVVVAEASNLEPDRVQQANTIREEQIRQLPIDRRDYLTYTLLAPGVVDSKALADASDYRVPQTRDSGLSFYGSNGRGNSVTIDGGDMSDFAGGVHETLS